MWFRRCKVQKPYPVMVFLLVGFSEGTEHPRLSVRDGSVYACPSFHLQIHQYLILGAPLQCLHLILLPPAPEWLKYFLPQYLPVEMKYLRCEDFGGHLTCIQADIIQVQHNLFLLALSMLGYTGPLAIAYVHLLQRASRSISAIAQTVLSHSKPHST